MIARLPNAFMLAAGLLVIVGGFSATPAQAQHIHFSFGHGHGHHHGWHHYHGCYDPFWCGPRYVYVAPPPVVRREIRYVEPVERVIETRVEVPKIDVSREATTRTVSTAASAAPVQIWNSGGERVPVAFLADGREVTLHDGQSFSLYGKLPRTIEFDRGGSFGTVRHEVAAGEYEFVISGTGWDLVPKAKSVDAVASRPAAPKNSLPLTISR
ncbi:MAG: hypothetical protein MUF06_17860 [Pirellulaceae bacterium]|jgi:hypothetical protein|nr:hypothetical protein [Pirellulaceae bacterium]